MFDIGVVIVFASYSLWVESFENYNAKPSKWFSFDIYWLIILSSDIRQVHLINFLLT